MVSESASECMREENLTVSSHVKLKCSGYDDTALQPGRCRNDSERTLKSDETCHCVDAGIIAMFVYNPDLAAGVYIDVDASIVDMSVLPSEYLRLSQQADLIATSNWRRPVLMNGGALIFRNTQRSMEILASWWAHRCYKHDQPGLWRAVFEQWPSWEAGNTAREDFWQQRHLTTMHYFAHNHHELREKARLQTRWKCEGTCDWLYRETGCLKEPLEMPGVLLLPTLPFNDGANKIKALQHFSGFLYYNESDQPALRGKGRAKVWTPLTSWAATSSLANFVMPGQKWGKGQSSEVQRGKRKGIGN
eukprot:6208017-Pleurochrysis_carterae.AAC.2